MLNMLERESNNIVGKSLNEVNNNMENAGKVKEKKKERIEYEII